MNSTASPALSRAFSGAIGVSTSRAPRLERREQALRAEHAEALQRASAASRALEQIKSARCGASCLRDLARTVALLAMIFGLPTVMLLSAPYLPKGNVLFAGMLLIGLGWLGASLALRRIFIEPA